jgi:urease accessory protein UreF
LIRFQIIIKNNVEHVSHNITVLKNVRVQLSVSQLHAVSSAWRLLHREKLYSLPVAAAAVVGGHRRILEETLDVLQHSGVDQHTNALTRSLPNMHSRMQTLLLLLRLLLLRLRRLLLL